MLRNASAFTRHYIITSVELAAFVFLTACDVHFFELLGDPFEYIAETPFYITWGIAFFFAVVTIRTVGYSDFVPFTFLGLVWIVVYVVRTAYLLIREIDSFFKSEMTQRRTLNVTLKQPNITYRCDRSYQMGVLQELHRGILQRSYEL